MIKQWLTHLTIGAYLMALGLGICSHTFKVGANYSTLMYFVVWDMFSGWAAYEGRMEIIGEGESGKFYELAPGPWGEFHPYGKIDRHHYDTYCNHGARLAKNTLDHTIHEPMVRIFVIEEEFPKRFNIPDDQYAAYYGKPKEFHQYYHVRAVLTADGRMIQSQPTWLRYQYDLSVRDNPRLMADAKRHAPFITEGKDMSQRGTLASGPFAELPSSIPVGAPLGE